MGAWGRVARLLGVEVMACAPTAIVLVVRPPLPEVIALGGACLALGYFFLRVPSAWPIQEGGWLGLAIGGGIGLAEAEAAFAVAGVALPWVRPWLLTVVACAGVGIAMGFLANYDRHHRALRALRPTPTLAGAQRFARLK